MSGLEEKIVTFIMIFFSTIFVFFSTTIIFIIATWNRSKRFKEQYALYQYNPNGKILDKRIIKKNNAGGKWERESDINPRLYVKVLLFSKGIAKAESLEIRRDDFVVRDFEDGKRKVIHVGLEGYNKQLKQELTQANKEKMYYFNQMKMYEIKVAQLQVAPHKEFEKFKEDHKAINRSGPIINSSKMGGRTQ